MGGPKTGEGRKISTNRCWTTYNEINYLNDLVSGRCIPINSQHVPAIPMKQILTMYIKHAKNRKRWETFNGIDLTEVVGHAEKLIGAEN